MRNKLILILLTVFVVGSIAGITALSTLQEDPKKTTTAAVGNEIQKKPDPQPLTVDVKRDQELIDRGYDNFYFIVTDSKGEPVEKVCLRGETFLHDGFDNRITRYYNICLETDEDGETEPKTCGSAWDGTYWINGTFETYNVPEGYKKFEVEFRMSDESGNKFDPIEITKKRDW